MGSLFLRILLPHVVTHGEVRLHCDPTDGRTALAQVEDNLRRIVAEERATVPAIDAPDAAGWYWLRPSPAHAWRIVRVEGSPEDGLVVTDPGVGMGTVKDWKRRFPEARWAGPIPGPAK